MYSLGDLVKLVLGSDYSGTLDYAKPQGWFDEFVKLTGQLPSGHVWSYDPDLIESEMHPDAIRRGGVPVDIFALLGRTIASDGLSYILPELLKLSKEDPADLYELLRKIRSLITEHLDKNKAPGDTALVADKS